MTWIVGILTAILVLDCLFLILLILVQLPKKEAGIGQAFGASATDALFGAGSGTALTKVTKYATGVFLAITFLLAIFNANATKTRTRSFEENLKQAKLPAEEATVPAAATKAAPPATSTVAAVVATNRPAATGAASLLISAPTNAPAAPANK
jgi:protein translocase SecG subunit